MFKALSLHLRNACGRRSPTGCLGVTGTALRVNAAGASRWRTL